jgi:hypothetical protein
MHVHTGISAVSPVNTYLHSQVPPLFERQLDAYFLISARVVPTLDIQRGTLPSSINAVSHLPGVTIPHDIVLQVVVTQVPFDKRVQVPLLNPGGKPCGGLHFEGWNTWGFSPQSPIAFNVPKQSEAPPNTTKTDKKWIFNSKPSINQLRIRSDHPNKLAHLVFWFLERCTLPQAKTNVKQDNSVENQENSHSQRERHRWFGILHTAFHEQQWLGGHQ